MFRKHCPTFEKGQTASSTPRHSPKPLNLPDGLVGQPCYTVAQLDGVQCPCLVDSGSQVTCIAESFYRTKLSPLELHPIHDLLHVIGAGGQKVPYLGYVEVEICFPKEDCGTDVKLHVLALVCPDNESNEAVPLLVGTNVLKHLVQDCEERAGFRYLKRLPIRKDWIAAYRAASLISSAKSNSPVVKVRSASKSPIEISKGESAELECRLNKAIVKEGECVLIGEPEGSPVPGVFCVYSQLINVTRHPCVKVLVKNMSEHNITIPPRAVVAEGEPLQWFKCINADQVPPELEKCYSSSIAAQNSSDLASGDVKLELDFGDSPVSKELKEHITERIQLEASSAFSLHDLDIGHAPGVTHKIVLTDDTPFKERTRRVSPADFDELKKHLHELLAAGVIEESDSPYASPIVLVRKKNGSLRMVVDYRRLNQLTRRDAYPLPRIEETFTLLSGSKWFSVLDLKSGYYQIDLEKSDCPKTAFTTPFGNWQFKKMPQGLTNSPATFQRTMEKVMSGINLKEVVAFLDDLIIFSETLKQHEERLMTVLKRISEYGLKLSPSKCKFFQKSVAYLGHQISEYGICPDPGKVSAITEWPVPTTVKEVRSFLGFSGYYRRFVDKYSSLAKPLNDLLKGEFSGRTKMPAAKTRVRQHLGDKWTEECQQAFDCLKFKLATAPVLGYADWKLPYILHTDASLTGLGAALYQVQDGKMRVISYASRGLSKSEKCYPVHKLEFLALKWAISEKFHDYLYGAEFQVLTDNNPLTYVLTTAKLDAAGHRWLSALSIYNFDIRYRSGKSNIDADGLSRRPHDVVMEPEDSLKHAERVAKLMSRAVEDPEIEILASEVLKAACARHGVEIISSMHNVSKDVKDFEDADNDEGCCAIETLDSSEAAIPDSFEDPEPWPGQPVLPGMTLADWSCIQREDDTLRRVIQLVQSGRKLDKQASRLEQPEVRMYLREWSRLVLKAGVLHRKVIRNNTPHDLLVIPISHRSRALEGIHDEVGHLGFERTLDLARARFYWPKMTRDVESKCKTCERCVLRKARAQNAAKLVNIKASSPMELLCMDFLTVEPDSGDIRNIFVLTDHFTKFAFAYPTKDQTARTVASILWENVICNYGFPKRIHSDQGANFESELIAELCKISGTKSRTTPYHPRGNPVERFNRTLLDMLGTLSNQRKENWRKYIRPLVHAYNCTRNDTTGETPFYLMFGRQPRLPIDLCFGIDPVGHNHKTHQKYVRDLRLRLKHAYECAKRETEKSQLANKRRWDQKIVASSLEEGDRVLIRNVNLRGKHKLADRWEPRVYVVLRQVGEDLPVYVVRPEDSENESERTVHRDLLRPCGFISSKMGNESVPVRQERMATRKFTGDTGTYHEVSYGSGQDSISSDDDGEDISPCGVPNLEVEEFYCLPQPESSVASVPLPTLSTGELENERGNTDNTSTSEERLGPTLAPPLCRRTTRVRKPPAYLRDFDIGSRMMTVGHSSPKQHFIAQWLECMQKLGESFFDQLNNQFQELIELFQLEGQG